MTPRTKNIVMQSVGVALAVGLLYLALRNVDFGGMWQALRDADYWWLVPLFVATMLSHFLRAWRWRMFLDAVPRPESSENGERVDLKTAFYAVMIGYLINMAVPRLGEVARAANLSSQSGLRFSSVFGTVVIERLLDFFALLLILVSVGFILAGSPAAEALVFEPLQTRLDSLSPGDLLLLALAVVLGAALLFWLPGFLMSRSRVKGSLVSRMAPVLRSFRLGFISLFKSPHRLGIVVTTLLIWFFYGLMLYLPLYMLHMAEPYNLGPDTGLVLLGIGSIGFVLPAPGGIGSFHYFVIETLVRIYAVPYEVAAGFAVLTHTAQVILLTVVGFACLLAQGSSLGGILRAAEKVEGGSQEDPILKPGTE